MEARAAGTRLLAATLLLIAPASASAEWQIKPFVGLTFGGSTTLIILDAAADNPQVAFGPQFGFGVGAVWLGEVFGIEGDIGHAPGVFPTGELALGSSVTTLTGNVVVALPRRVAGYGLRPYLVAGGGLMRANIEDALDALTVVSNFRAIDLGGGATGFVTDRVGLSWDLRWFRNVGSSGVRGNSFLDEQLSFWRASMALAIRY
jgi:hypothetical protein